MDEKLFSIADLKNKYFFKFLKENDLDTFCNDDVYDDGKVNGIIYFLNFCEDEYNLEHDNTKY